MAGAALQLVTVVPVLMLLFIRGTIMPEGRQSQSPAFGNAQTQGTRQVHRVRWAALLIIFVAKVWRLGVLAPFLALA